jgi:Flp pilus assembly protein TadG
LVRQPIRAQSTVEAALVFPLLLVAALGVVQFALWMHSTDVVVAAVQDGARVASSEGGNLNNGLDAAQGLLRQGLGASAARVRVEASEDRLLVRFEANGDIPAVLPFVGQLPVRATASMAKDRFRP